MARDNGGALMMHVVVATSHEYLPWCATTIKSLVDIHAGDVLVHVLHDRALSSADCVRLETIGAGAIDFPVIDEDLLLRLPSQARFGGRTALLPLLSPELLPQIPRAIVLDVDTLVTGRLDALWMMPLEGLAFAAVPNVIEPAMRPRVASLGLDPREYLNSGVQLVDLDAVRSDGSFAEVLRLVSARSLFWFDQDALSIVFKGRWLRLHPRWNAMNSLWIWRQWADEVFGADVVREAIETPAIVHFEGPALCKPWHYLSDHPWTDRYRACVASTPWRGQPLVDRTMATRLIKRLPRAMRVPAYWRLVRARQAFDRRETKPPAGQLVGSTDDATGTERR